MEEMYEVLSFVEHGAHCRQTMDCVQGTLLIEYIKENPQIEKQVLFEWFRKIGVCLDQYHRCRNRRSYRYLNPYSVVVTEERNIRLLDMEAPENGFVMKQMQKRAMREHFVKPVYGLGKERTNCADLFAYGKTLRFILACSCPEPELTRWEEARLLKLTERCMGESKKSYEDFQEVLKSLPSIKRNGRDEGRRSGHRTARLAWSAAACVILCTALAVGRQGLASDGEQAEELLAAEKPDAAEIEIEAAGMESFPGEPAGSSEEETAAADAGSKITADEIVDQTAETLESYMQNHNLDGWEEAVSLGERLERHAVKSMAYAYAQMGQREDALMAYGRLIEIAETPAEVEEAALGKMELEAEAGLYDQAVQTGRLVLQKNGQSEKISARIAEYEAVCASVQDQQADEE